MDIGHSRLLKFLLPGETIYRTSMSEKHSLKIEDLNPTDIEAEVPKPQILRSPLPHDGNPPQTQHNKAEIPMDTPHENVSEGKLILKQGNTVETYAPVITVKTVESNFGKEGLKFQRVTVTEDVSVNFQHLFKKETKGGKTDVPTSMNGMRGLLNPVFVGESARPAERFWIPPQEDMKDSGDNTLPEEKKVKTRIPVSRFKPAVTKVLKEKKKSEEVNEPSKREVRAPEKPPRRSSIPKLNDRILTARKCAFKSEANDQGTVSNQAEEIVKTTIENQRPNEKKSAKSDRIPVLRRNLNRTKDNHSKTNDYQVTRVNSNDQVAQKLKDEPVANENEKLDEEFDKLFEEIGDMEAESIPIEILETRVKDPVKLDVKFEEIVHQYDHNTIERVKLEPRDKAKYRKIPLLKRRSEQEIKIPKQYVRRSSLKTGNSENNTTKQDDEEIKNHQNNTKNETIDKTDDSDDIIADNVERDLSIEINNNDYTEAYLAQSQSPMEIPVNNVIATPDVELVKVGLSNFGNSKQNPVNANVTPEPETVRVSVLEPPFKINDISSEINKDITPEEVKYIEYTVEEPISINDTQYIESIYTVEKPEVADIIHDTTTIDNDVFIVQSNSESEKREENNQYDPTAVETTNLETPIQIDLGQKDITVPRTNAESESIHRQRNKNGVENKPDSRYDYKPLVEETFNKNVKEEDVSTRGKVSRILKRLTSKENTNNERINKVKNGEHVELNKNDVTFKENDNKIIDRIAPHDIDDKANKEHHILPMKKSVLSKIAMFEQATPEPVAPRKPTHKYVKPQRTISEEIKHSPKIVEEVLKPSTRKQAESPYQVINIDIMQPVEIITQNEEQISVVENLEEDTIVFEKLDEFKAEEPLSVQNEPVSLIFTKNSELTSTNDGDVYHEHEKSEKSTNNELNLENTDSDNKRQERDFEKRNDVHYIPVKEKIHRLKSHEDFNIRRAKSTAELDLGDAVKGKVKHMIVRMSSMDLLDDHTEQQREVINVKERPRKRSVSDKIALFEKKLVPVKMDTDMETARAININEKPSVQSINSVAAETVPRLEEEVNAKILELSGAKMTYGSVANMTYMELRDGKKMPVLALGTALLNPLLAKHIVMAAIDLGYRAIDTAFIYGTENAVGEGIRAKIQDGTVKREDLFIMSKLWSTFHAPELVEDACRASLRAMGLEYFDLFMIHNPMSLKEGGDPLPKIAGVLQYSSHDYLDAWFAMEDLVTLGLVRSIGVSNFNSVQVARVVEKARIKPVVDQVECHPYLSQQPLSEFCEARGVALSCFGVLGSKGTPAELKSSQPAAIDDPMVQVMAAGLGISPAQLLISYQLKCGHSVVVKGSSAAHLWDNLRALGAALDGVQVAALHALNKNRRAFAFKGMGDTHKNYPFNILF